MFTCLRVCARVGTVHVEIREDLVGGDSLSNRLDSEGLSPMSSLTFLNTRLFPPPHPPVSPYPVGYPSCLSSRIEKVESLNKCTWALPYGKSQKVGTSLCGPSDPPLGFPCPLLWASISGLSSYLMTSVPDIGPFHGLGWFI